MSILVYADGTMRVIDSELEGIAYVVPELDRHGDLFERRFELHLACQEPLEQLLRGPRRPTDAKYTVVGVEVSYKRIRR